MNVAYERELMELFVLAGRAPEEQIVAAIERIMTGIPRTRANAEAILATVESDYDYFQAFHEQWRCRNYLFGKPMIVEKRNNWINLNFGGYESNDLGVSYWPKGKISFSCGTFISGSISENRIEIAYQLYNSYKEECHISIILESGKLIL